jgi:adenylosuccinate synthase
MKRATVVIGANYGDEGKGLMVDYLASRIPGEKVIVRFNGGAQAGHTVETPDGVRHIFSHFGSGTLAGAQTYLAKHFVCNPLLFWRERKRLEDAGAQPIVAIDPRCFVTTPYDMMLNQAVEDARGDKRHGSVGLGFGETIERNSVVALQLWKADLADNKKVEEKLHLIRDQWLPLRCSQLGLPMFPKDDMRLTDESLGKIIEATEAFEAATVTAGAEFLERKEIIFEGAQGLCLDMGSKNFPHVTRSNTGLTNVIPIATGMGLSLEVIYMTRPYLTKHGAGPLPNEYTPNPPIEDRTNAEHPYQGRFRFAHLNFVELHERIGDDLRLSPNTEWSVGLTCLDHVGVGELSELSSRLMALRFYSQGPRRDHVAEIVHP